MRVIFLLLILTNTVNSRKKINEYCACFFLFFFVALLFCFALLCFVLLFCFVALVSLRGHNRGNLQIHHPYFKKISRESYSTHPLLLILFLKSCKEYCCSVVFVLFLLFVFFLDCELIF